MRLTKDKKDRIRAAIVARTFPDKVFSDAAAPLVDALRTNAVVDGAARALEDFPQYVSGCATLTVSLGHGRSCLVRLPFPYARYGGFSPLMVCIGDDGQDGPTFHWSGWGTQVSSLPPLDRQDIHDSLTRIRKLLEKRHELDAKLEAAMERISSPKALAEKIPATAEYLTEELASAATQTKAVVPMEVVQRVRRLLGCRLTDATA